MFASYLFMQKLSICFSKVFRLQKCSFFSTHIFYSMFPVFSALNRFFNPSTQEENEYEEVVMEIRQLGDKPKWEKRIEKIAIKKSLYPFFKIKVSRANNPMTRLFYNECGQSTSEQIAKYWEENSEIGNLRSEEQKIRWLREFHQRSYRFQLHYCGICRKQYFEPNFLHIEDPSHIRQNHLKTQIRTWILQLAQKYSPRRNPNCAELMQDAISVSSGSVVEEITNPDEIILLKKCRRKRRGNKQFKKNRVFSNNNCRKKKPIAKK